MSDITKIDIMKFRGVWIHFKINIEEPQKPQHVTGPGRIRKHEDLDRSSPKISPDTRVGALAEGTDWGALQF